jgi:hypothetical protein
MRSTGAWSLIPLAGPANRQRRIAADNICARDSRYQGTWGTAILRLFGLRESFVKKNYGRSALKYHPIHLFQAHPHTHTSQAPRVRIGYNHGL